MGKFKCTDKKGDVHHKKTVLSVLEGMHSEEYQVACFLAHPAGSSERKLVIKEIRNPKI